MKPLQLLLFCVFIVAIFYPNHVRGRSFQINQRELTNFGKSPAYYDVRTWKVDPEDIPHLRVARATRRRLNYNGFGGRFRLNNNNDLPSSVNYQNSYDRFPTVA